MKNKNSDAKLEQLIEQVDWTNTNQHERQLFAQSFSMMELATLAVFRASSIRSGRLVSMIATLMTILLLVLFEAKMETIVITVSAIQILLFLFSQLFELFTKRVYNSVEGTTTDIVKTLAQKHPKFEKTEE